MNKYINNRDLQRKIAVVIVVKLIVLTLIWQFFFSENKVKVDSKTVEQHLFQAAEPVNKTFH